MAGIEKLNELNAVLVPPANDPLATTVNETPVANTTHGSPASEAEAADVPALGQPLPPSSPSYWGTPVMPTVMPQPQPQARHNLPAVIVGQTRVGQTSSNELHGGLRRRKNGNRGKDKKQRKMRKGRPAECSRCKMHAGANYLSCKGRGGIRYCENFDENGNPM